MRQIKKINRIWKWMALSLAGLLVLTITSVPAHAGHFILGAPGVMVTDVTVNTGRDCFKRGDTLTISGHGFGSGVGDRVIVYATQGPMSVESWKDTEIRFRIPTAAEAPKFTPLGNALMIMDGKNPFILYGHGPVFCGANKKL